MFSIRVECCIFLNLYGHIRSLVLVVFNNFLLIDATDRSKISSDQKRFFIALSLSFFANTPFKANYFYYVMVYCIFSVDQLYFTIPAVHVVQFHYICQILIYFVRVLFLSFPRFCPIILMHVVRSLYILSNPIDIV